MTRSTGRKSLDFYLKMLFTLKFFILKEDSADFLKKDKIISIFRPLFGENLENASRPHQTV